jgi:hypothetical protein
MHTCALYRFVQVTVGHEDSGENAPFRDEDVGESGVLIVAKNRRESSGHKAETTGRSGTLGAAQRSRLSGEDSGESPSALLAHAGRSNRTRHSARVISHKNSARNENHVCPTSSRSRRSSKNCEHPCAKPKLSTKIQGTTGEESGERNEDPGEWHADSGRTGEESGGKDLVNPRLS